MSKTIVMRAGYELSAESHRLLELMVENDQCIEGETQTFIVLGNHEEQRVCPVFPNSYCSLNDLVIRDGKVHLNQWSVGGVVDLRNRDTEDALNAMLESERAIGYVYLRS